MLTVRNEHEPFNGRVPRDIPTIPRRRVCVRPDNTQANKFNNWMLTDSIRSPLAEVVWFAIENPGYTEDPPTTDPSANHFFGEPGMRTIYRRTLLIAPWLNPYRYIDRNGVVSDTFTYDGGSFKAQPGLMRILPKKSRLRKRLPRWWRFRIDTICRFGWNGTGTSSGGRSWRIRWAI